MKGTHAVILVTLILLGFLVLGGLFLGTANPVTPGAIEGTWSVSGDQDGFGWYLTYRFDNGTYTMEGYPPISKSGTYTATEVEPRHYQLTLTPNPEEYTSAPAPETWDVWLSEDGKTIDVTNGYTYTFQAE